MGQQIHLGMIAGEASGDILGAGLINALKQQVDDCRVDAVAGPLMRQAGATVLEDSEVLSVMGLTEVIAVIPKLWRLRQRLVQTFIQSKPDVFVGIDAPDFNLGLESKLKRAGIPVIHYVSPSVWAWRQYRVRKIARSTDLVLTLFPFETAFYEKHGVAAKFVGHPLADMIPDQPDSAAARRDLGLNESGPIVAMLPGSRKTEIEALCPDFLRALKLCLQDCPDLHVVTPAASATLRQRIEMLHRDIAPELPLTLVDGHSREVMASADTVLLASGTAALEAMLLKRPMVVGARVSKGSYWLAKRLVKVEHISLPNLLAGKTLVPELIQDDVKPQALADHVLSFLKDHQAARGLQKEFQCIHDQLRCGASYSAAQAVLETINK